MGEEEVYDMSFVDGKLHILRRGFEMRTEIKHTYVHRTIYVYVVITHGFSVDLTMGIASKNFAHVQ